MCLKVEARHWTLRGSKQKKSPDNKTNNDNWRNDLLETHVMFYSIIDYGLLCKNIFGSSFFVW